VFGNRPAGQFDLTSGFLPGDLIYIPNGITVTLTVDIEPEPYNPPNNVGPSNLHSVNNYINYIDVPDNITKTTTYSLTNITQVYSVPILLILGNFENFLPSDYGNKYVDVGISNNLGNRNWLSVSVSSVGNYQSIGDDQGMVFVSSDYGKTWNNTLNIGSTPTLSIGVSETGRYQTVSNGTDIYTSNDYGSTWTHTLSIGSSKIFVSVSLHGQYQTVLSCGDSVYTSRDYGQTWSRLDESSNADFYNSIETFPTGGVAISFTGQIQAVACESIWISRDYGQTWNDTFKNNHDDWYDHNWDGIAMSSTGQVMTAVDSGGDIYNSQDSGVTWIRISDTLVDNKEWECISMSATSTYQTAIEVGGAIYYSIDKGLTWNKTSDPKMQGGNWSAVSVSANGQYQTVVTYGGSIYICTLV
jgi:hypothetical protein